MTNDERNEFNSARHSYVSCIRIQGRPILPPLLHDDQRSAMRALRDQAVALEQQLKETKRRRLLERLQMDFDQLAPVAKLNGNTSMLVGTHEKSPIEENITFRSLPITPVYEGSVEELHSKFLQLKAEAKDVSISDRSVSITSTDLSPYMQNGDPGTGGTDADTCCSEVTETVTVVSSESETTSLECSTPVKPQERIRRLSYTLEAPSPVLLKQMQTQQNNNESVGTSNKESKLIFSIADSLNPSNTAAAEPSILAGDKISPRVIQPLANVTNGNTDLNRIPAQQYPVIFSDFLQHQQKLMQELLDQQAKEQDRLAALFKEQEKQLMMQLELQRANVSKKSPARRNLQSSFDSVSASKFTKLTALARGYLTRRLMATDRVQELVQTIRDTTTCLRELDHGNMTILPSDVELHRRLLQQLAGAVQSFHDIFFGMEVAERMMIISRDREKKFLSVNGAAMKLRPRSRSLSSATVKSLERKQLTRRDSGPTPVHSSRPSSSQRESRSRPWSVSSFSSVASNSTSGTVSNGSSICVKKKASDKGRKPWRC